MRGEGDFTLRIERLAAGGDGVGRRADGITVFVPLAAPGDLLRVRVVERRRRFLRAEIEAVLEPGPDRVTPACDVFGRCGGCAWQHLAYPAQLEAKRSILADALRRIGGQTLAERPAVTPSPAAYGYRARARLLEADGAVGYRARRSHVLCAVERCPVLVPELAPALDTLRARAARGGARREWAIDVGSDGAPRIAEVDAAAREDDDAEPIAISLGSDLLELSPGAFAQANALLWTALHRRVVEAAGEGERLLELYAGAGFFTLALARRFVTVEAVESSPVAAADLRANLDRAGCAGVRVVESRVETALPGRVTRDPAVVVLDPPRRGLPERSVGALADLGPRRIVYLSCDPATWARDAARLTASGYALVGAEGFDLFPQTPHVEALAVFDRAQ